MSYDKQAHSELELTFSGDHNRLLFQSRDVEQVREAVSKIYKPHRLDINGKARELNASMYSVSLGQVIFNRLRYGADVTIDPQNLEQFYLIQMPLTGCSAIYSGLNYIASNPFRGSVLNPTEPLKMRWSEDSDKLMFRIDKTLLEQACSVNLGMPMREKLIFRNDLGWQEDPVWRNMVFYISRLLNDYPAAPEMPLIRHQLEQLVVNTLLTIQPHSYTEQLIHPERQKIAPRHVKRVEAYIEEHITEPLTPNKLAEIAGVSVRTLYSGFKDFRQVSPMEYVRYVRLEKVKETLEKFGDSISVTDAALNWGFTHMGRFSIEYQKAFGEKPSDTKRQHSHSTDL